jgi:hypothetical protein
MNTEHLSDEALLQLLRHFGYKEPRVLPDGRFTAIHDRMIYTSAIIICSRPNINSSIDERFCYHDVETATAALAKWDGTGEPEGWHRHIPSGRRRDKGDPLKEYINP